MYFTGYSACLLASVGVSFQKHRFLRPRNEFPGFGRRKSDAPGQKAEVRRLNWRDNGLPVRELRQRWLLEVQCPGGITRILSLLEADGTKT
ncbi:Protein Jagged-2 [Manis pentadactyla]|nr:Protein Jagged-2 [Manis pentadactyla]